MAVDFEIEAYERELAKADQDQERWKETCLNVFSMIVIGSSMIGSILGLLFVPGSSSWAALILTLLIGGRIGYHLGRPRTPKTPS